MGKDKTGLGDRMKGYENINRNHLISRMPVVLRLDGKAFHTFCRKFDKPFDKVMVKTMQETMRYLCEHIQGCVLGYTQSDEITLVLVDYETFDTCSWFDNNIQKMVSVAASMATYVFNKTMMSYSGFGDIYRKKVEDLGGLFDCRAFNVPREDLLNCVLWRIKDCTRNSKQSLGQAHFSQKELHKKSTDEVVAMVKDKTGILWDDLPTTLKYGTFCVKKSDSGFMLISESIKTYGDLEDFCSKNCVFF